MFLCKCTWLLSLKLLTFFLNVWELAYIISLHIEVSAYMSHDTKLTLGIHWYSLQSTVSINSWHEQKSLIFTVVEKSFLTSSALSVRHEGKIVFRDSSDMKDQSQRLKISSFTVFPSLLNWFCVMLKVLQVWPRRNFDFQRWHQDFYIISPKSAVDWCYWTSNTEMNKLKATHFCTTKI